jgi:purine-binding chemotaxis protein CheW
MGGAVSGPGAVPRAAPLRERVATESALRLVTFQLGGRVVACHVDHVEEVVHEPRMHPMPAAPPHLIGLLRLRGELVPVLDIAPWLGLPPEARPGAVVLLQLEAHRFGIAASEVGAIADIAAAQVRLVQTEREAQGGQVGFARIGPSLAVLIEPADLIATLRSPKSEELP